MFIYGEPRFTRDIDITLGIDVDEIEKIKKLTASLNLVPGVNNADLFAKKTNVFPTVHKQSGIRVDFIFSYSNYEKQAIKKSRTKVIGGVRVKFISPEDLIIHKVIAGRPRDMEDVLNIILKNRNINLIYIKRILSEFYRALSANYTERLKKNLKYFR